MAEFLSQRGLEICPKKTKLVYNFKINDFFITPSLNVKFLEIILDHSFTFNDHFKYLSDKLTKTLNVLRVLRGVWWGAHPYTLITVYDALIRSCLGYGAHIFTFKNYKLFDRLEKIRNRALRLAIGYRTSTPINVMLSESCEPPLKFRFSFLAKKYLTRSFSNLNHPLTVNLNILWVISKEKNNPYKIFDIFTLLTAFDKTKEFKT